MADKIDFKKTLPAYRAKLGRFDLIEVPDHQYLMIDGHGDPNASSEYGQALKAIYPVAYKLKFASKLGLGRDYVVPPLEGLWWAQNMDVFTVARDKSQWDWTMMIMTPDWITADMFDVAVTQVGAKDRPAGLEELRLATLSDPRKTAPQKLRTILRQPVSPI